MVGGLGIGDPVMAIADPAALARWRVKALRENRIMSFAEDRALRLGLYDELLGDAQTITCARCGTQFLEPDGDGIRLRTDLTCARLRQELCLVPDSGRRDAA